MENQVSNSTTDSTGKVITCKAAVVWGPGEPFVIEQVRVDPPEKMEVRLKILFTSVCHTDLSAWKGQMHESYRAYPIILGHEAVGIVESVGEGVREVKAGDYVIPLFNGECGHCVYCKCEKTNKCVHFGVEVATPVMVGDGRTRFSTADGKPIFHFFNTSTFSEYTVVPSACVVKIDSDAPIKKMVLLGCCFSTGVGAAWNVANVQAGSTVAVFGLGAVGLAVAEGARSRGASKIIGVDINPNKFIKGKAVGISDFINPLDSAGKSVNEIIKEMTDGGVDYSFECAGGNLQVLREAFLSTHEGWGILTLLGVQLRPELLPIHPMELFSGRTILASFFGGFKGRTQLPTFAKQCVSGLVNLDEFITHELPLENINQAVQLLVDGDSIRSILHF